jgi:hypothetical protein
LLGLQWRQCDAGLELSKGCGIAAGLTARNPRRAIFYIKYHSASRWLLLFYNTILIEVLTLPPNGIEALIADEETHSTSGLILPSSDTATGASAP